MEETKTFTQEEVDKLINDRLARERKKFDAEKKELERKHNESIEEYEERVKTANMSAEEKYTHELEKVKKSLEEKEATLKKMNIDSLKLSALSKYKLPEKFINRISGETEEEIEESVKSFQEGISEYLKTQAGGTPTNMSGGSKEITDESNDKFEEILNGKF